MALIALSACGRFEPVRNGQIVHGDEASKLEQFTEPTRVLTPSSPETANPYSVYDLVSAHFGVDANVQTISARVQVQSTAGTETVELVGSLRPDGSASLIDLSPLPDGKNRLVGEALCTDLGHCEKIILNVYYNVAGKTLKKQFSSDALKVEAAADAAEKAKTPTAPLVKARERSDGTTDADPTETTLPDETHGADEQLGDFVGAPRNEILIGKLWPRSHTPELPPVLAHAEELPVPAPVAPKAPPAKVPPKAKVTPTKPSVSPQKPSLLSKWIQSARTYLQRKKTTEKRPAQTAPAKPIVRPQAAKPVAGPQKPVPAVPSQPRKPLATKPQPQPITPVPGKPTAPVTTPSPSPTPEYPFPPATVAATESELDQKIGFYEAKLAPLLNLRDGGEARGSYGYSANPKSAIVNANLLPAIPGLVPVKITANAHYGSGMLVSFLENAATYLLRTFGLSLYVGDMSLKNGGAYGGSSSHNTHRNGLDADVAWVGSARPLVDSALDRKGEMVADFDYEKTWTFLTLAARQELIVDAQKTTAVSRVYMSHHVKDGFCAWARDKGLLEDPFNSELMRLVRREAGHTKHFHLSLKCSPHYPLCRNLAGPPPPGPGC